MITQAYLQYTERGKLAKSQHDRDTLISMMRSHCRDYTAVDSNGRYLVPFDMGRRYQEENHVLRMLNHKIGDLQPADQVAVLRTFIDHHLPYMLHSSTVTHDLQRKAIKMLADLLPAVIRHPEHKAHLLASLIRQLNSNGISTERKTDAGIWGTSDRPNSDLAAKLIENELKAVRSKARKCAPRTLGRLAGSFNDALRGYGALMGRRSSLHTEQWEKTFFNPKLDPRKWLS